MAVDISDLPAPTKGVDISDLPAPPPAPKKEPSYGQKAGAFALGLGTGVLGLPGDIESMITPESKGELAGYETVFPTAKEFQRGKRGFPLMTFARRLMKSTAARSLYPPSLNEASVSLCQF